MEVKKYNPRKFASPIVGTFARHFGLNAMNNTTIEAELPAELAAQARAFVAEGWAADFNELLAEALRRFLESHEGSLTGSFVKEDVDWGLRGQH